MGLKFILKTKSSTFAELFADRGHPGPKIFIAFLNNASYHFGTANIQISS